MNKYELIEIAKIITNAYEYTEFSADKLELWHSFLKDYDFTLVEKNLRKHILTRKSTPKIANLVEGLEPNEVEETNNHNAGEKIMLMNTVYTAIDQGGTIEELAKHGGISPQTLIKRLDCLGLEYSQTEKALKVKSGWRHPSAEIQISGFNVLNVK